MHRDLRGEPVSCANGRVCALFEQALQQFQSYVGDPVATIDEALEEDADFVLGHVFRATALLLMSERQYLPEARKSVWSAEALAGKANDRERGLIVAARRWLDGDWAGACRAWDEVLVHHPRDAFAIQAAHLTDFYRGDAINLRDRIARVLPHWSEGTPGYSYVLGMYAFGLEECNLYGRAEEAGRRALEIEPKDGWAVHAVAHVMEMEARFDEGIEWYNTRQADWSPDNAFAFHNWWHLGLYHQERAEYRRALSIYDKQILPEPSDVSLQLVDASAFLWRLHLQDVDTGDRWAGLANIWEQKSEVENGYYAFNDLHALMAFVADGREQQTQQLMADLGKAAAGGRHINAMMTRDVGMPVCRAFYAFARGEYHDAIEWLLPFRTIARRFGGSHAQRDVLSQTLIEAAIRGGRHELARNLINEREQLKPHSPLAWRFMSKARKAAGDREGAIAARTKANDLVSESSRRQAA
ncbi:MAG: tetratricopeptide repeat protein [Gammaproteobacteria bacterium]